MSDPVLLDQAQLAEAVRRFRTDESVLRTKFATLKNLQERDQQGDLAITRESQAEQTFNERVFADILGYRSMLQDPSGTYNLKPKVYANGNYNDFALGFFGDGQELTIVSAELKDANTDLDTPSTTDSRRRTPVEQAFDAAERMRGVKWVIVSNFRTIRVYRNGYKDAHHCFNIAEVNTIDKFREFYFVLCRDNLIVRSGESVMDRLYAGSLDVQALPPTAYATTLESIVSGSESFTFNAAEIAKSVWSAVRLFPGSSEVALWPILGAKRGAETDDEDGIILEFDSGREVRGEARFYRTGDVRIRTVYHRFRDNKIFEPRFLLLDTSSFIRFLDGFYRGLAMSPECTVRIGLESIRGAIANVGLGEDAFDAPGVITYTADKDTASASSPKPVSLPLPQPLDEAVFELCKTLFNGVAWCFSGVNVLSQFVSQSGEKRERLEFRDEAIRQAIRGELS
jgi:hypothetical protein